MSKDKGHNQPPKAGMYYFEGVVLDGMWEGASEHEGSNFYEVLQRHNGDISVLYGEYDDVGLWKFRGKWYGPIDPEVVKVLNW